MKGFRFYIVSLAFLLTFSGFVFAQIEKAPVSAESKIGFIDAEAFYDKQTGIREIVETNEKLEAEFKPQADELKSLAEKILKLQDELDKLRASKILCRPDISAITSKSEEYDKLVTEYKQKEKGAGEFYKKRETEVFADVYKKIGAALQQFAREKGYAFILDVSKCRDTFILAEPDGGDVTSEFIKYYNESFVKTITQ